jgi:L-lysine 6-transaminase
MTAVLPYRELTCASDVTPGDVHEVLRRSILADGLDFVLDVERSAGSHLVDAGTG